MNTDWFKLVESYTMHLDFTYSKTSDWMLHIWKKGCGENDGNLTIFSDQDCDPDLLLAKGEVALKTWLKEHLGGN